jgi:HD-like signal output (HDOD) protein
MAGERLMSMEEAAQLVDNIEDLPTLPEVVIGITQLVDDPDATAEDIYKIVSTDPSLSATMLKLVNSAFYGMSRSVTSLEQAIKILGFVTVRNLALAAFVFDAFVTGKGHFDYKSFWLHSIGAATGTKVLAERLKIKESGEYFVHGLLHDLGTVVLMQYESERFAQVVQAADERNIPLIEAEEEMLGCTHREIGSALADKWDFPPALSAVMRYHCMEDFPEEFSREVALTSCASLMAASLEIGEMLSPAIASMGPKSWQVADIEPSDMGGLMDSILDEMEKSRGFINLLFA